MSGPHVPAPVLGDVPAAADQPPPDAGPVVNPPPPTWVTRVRELAQTCELPRLLPEQGRDRDNAAEQARAARAAAEWAVQVEGCWTLHPWSLMRDVGALLAWARQLEAPLSVWRVSEHTLVIYGQLAGYPTRLVGSSNRLPTDSLVALTFPLLEQIEGQEVRWCAGVADPAALDPVPLAPAQLADPLTTQHLPVQPAPAPWPEPVYADSANAPAWVYEQGYQWIYPGDFGGPPVVARGTDVW